jgi:hypothetical protein
MWISLKIGQVASQNSGKVYVFGVSKLWKKRWSLWIQKMTFFESGKLLIKTQFILQVKHIKLYCGLC